MKTDSEFSALDRKLGEFLQALDASAAPEVRLAAMCASRARANGNICVSLQEIADNETVRPTTLRKKLKTSQVVGAPGDFTPLILDAQDRVYLRRYWEYEQQLAQAILARAASSPAPSEADADFQELAAAKAVANKFTVITGGPGTGKTRTVMRILELLFAQPHGETLRVALAAPTGKAAARMTESVRAVRENLAATTIHRLLGYVPGSPSFRQNAQKPLAADVVIIDEASMVDLALMAKLVVAVPPSARLILLGDRDQLASVEAGSVLADICAAAEEAAPNEPLHGSVVHLGRNYRFAETGGIYRASAAINSGNAEAAVTALRSTSDGEARWHPLPAAARLPDALRARVVEAFGPYLQAGDPVAALAALQNFRLLCALRHGPFGVENLTAVVEEILSGAGLLLAKPGWYGCQPIMITQNDYNLGLFNGDSGVVLPDAEADGDLRAFFFASSEGKVRRFLPSRLPAHETAFAITVHKSQGSEFSEVLLVLPAEDSPVLTRELLYTGLTRAREKVELWSSEAILLAAINRQVSRTSGLRDALAAKTNGSRQSGSNR
jgi:exodeoxyribonuclease V alpha subunit